MIERHRNVNPSREAMEAAARWFLQLQEEAVTAQTFSDWNKWLAASGENRRAYDEIEDTVLRLKRVPGLPDLPSPAEMAADTYDGSISIGDFTATPETKVASARNWRPFALAAGVAAVGIVSMWLWTQHDRSSQFGSFVYQTAAGDKKLVELPDGSKVTLDADSALDVRLTPERRTLTLSRGEAYFQVAKDRSRPFTVQAGATQVTAIGTAFNVRMSENRTIVAVVEGKVEVVAKPRTDNARTSRNAGTDKQIQPSTVQLTAQLSAGEAVSYVDDGNLYALPTAEASLATGWLDGRRQYRNEPLRYVLADIDRYTGRRIEIADESTGALQFTGTLNLENSEGWLQGLSVALPVEVTRKNDGTLSIKHR